MAVDDRHGGFVSNIDHSNQIDHEAPKGSVLNSRILWAFSAGYHFTGEDKYLQTADRAFDYFSRHFIDPLCGGVYWTVDAQGAPLDTRKQIYALAFAVYGMSEYFLASGREEARQSAIAIYNSIVQHSYDERHGGYAEALTRDWGQAADLRLSPKDANEKKSMNTHLHLLESFANLLKIWDDAALRKRVIELLDIFTKHIINSQSHHLVLFFDELWNPRSALISYGHDIEASWLLLEAAAKTGDQSLLPVIKQISLQLATASTTGLDHDGGLWYEYETANDHLVKEKHSWPQAEAMVGFLNAWQLTGNRQFLDHSLRSWQFIKEHVRDDRLGEWYWGVHADYSPMIEKEKAGLWKCPYHNTRACIEVMQRIANILNNKT